MSAQLSAADRPNFESGDMYKGKPEEYVAAGLSYLAYSGPYYVDEANRIVEHEMFVSLFPNWKGQRQARIVKLDVKELQLGPNRPLMFNGSPKMATITWRRANPNVCERRIRTSSVFCSIPAAFWRSLACWSSGSQVPATIPTHCYLCRRVQGHVHE